MIQIHGFHETRTCPLPELSATLHQMEHSKTGAQLVWLEREEENKTFGIAFPTLPSDDTGVFHILEHSVLCGSDKYPVKEPFVELLKHSMSTFLNAFTFPDKTLYPLSSRNHKDFLTLMRVYLDAVFHPAIYHKPEIFRQEGWHYEFDSQGTASYKGVVFNEMKGAFADADELEVNAINRALFPETPYRYVSGGDPASIPNLSYQQFLENHRRFYAPSNALIFLDGAVDLEAVLQILDQEYFSGFEASPKTVFPPLQSPVDGGVQTVKYEVAPGEEEGKTRLAWGMVLGSFQDRETLVAAQVLAKVLCGDNQSPLPKAVLARQLAENVNLSVYDGVQQPWLQLEIRNLKSQDKEAAQACVFGELERLVREGIDRRKLEAAMANLEFRMRERDYGSYPAGIILCMGTLESWLYGGDPEANLQVGDLFDRLRAKVDQGYFEDLLHRMLLDNPHRCQVILEPDASAGEGRRQQEAQRLARETQAFTPSQRQELLQQQEALEQWQKTPDTPEQLATLPSLALSDLPEKPADLPLKEVTVAGLPGLLHTVETGGIAYVNLYFDGDGLSVEELSQLAYLCKLLGHMDTKSHTAEELNDQVRLLCGNLQFAPRICWKKEDLQQCKVKLWVSLSALERNLSQALDLVGEILTETILEDGAAAHDILRQQKMEAMERCVMAGHSVGLSRIMAQISPVGVAQEYLTGFENYRWMKEQDQCWDWDHLRPQLQKLLTTLPVKARLTWSLTGKEELSQQVAEAMAAVLPEGTPSPAGSTLKPWGPRREGIVIPADISFACCGGDFLAGREYSGAWRLVVKLLSLEYLWTVIRVQGGAYGTGLVAHDTGLAACYSYRDPQGKASLEKYGQCASFLKTFCQEGHDLTGLIIGAASDSEPLLTPRTKGLAADTNYWNGVTYADRCRRWQELLATTSADLLAMAPTLEQALQGGVVVVGSRPQLEACKLDSMESV